MHGGSGLPIKMKWAGRASRNKYVYIMMICTRERHLYLLHLTLIEIFQISVRQMSVDKRIFNM